MRALLVLAGGCCLFASQPKLRVTAEQMSPMGPIDPQVTSRIGPLALETFTGVTPDRAAQEARRRAADRYLDRARIHEETSALRAVLDTFYQPLTPETRVGFDLAHQGLAWLERYDPFSVHDVTRTYSDATWRLALCIHHAGIATRCDHERRPPAARAPVFDVEVAVGGILKVTISDLRDAADPAWREFPAATRRLDNLRGLVLDLRDARGSDPRALLPWIGELAGRPGLRPLRAIERPAAAGAYAKAYGDRHTDRGRDPEVWRALVDTGEPVARTAALAKPLAVVVGRNCESACELIARILETYAGAIIVGGVLQRSGRLARDEPALFVLPHSQASVYFYATRYLLSAEIEAATGATEGWRALPDDFDDHPRLPGHAPWLDNVAWATREVARRLVDPKGWPRCDSLPSSTADTAKLRGTVWLAPRFVCDGGYQITVRSEIPPSAFRSFVATCSPPHFASTSLRGVYWVGAKTSRPSVTALSQIAASELVASVEIDCLRKVDPGVFLE